MQGDGLLLLVLYLFIIIIIIIIIKICVLFAIICIKTLPQILQKCSGQTGYDAI